MTLRRVIEAFRTPLGRGLLASVGLGIVGMLLSRAGAHSVLHALSRAAPLFPVVLFLELGILACSTCALHSLYGEDGKQIPLSAWIRSALIGYSVMGVVPAGRAVAEAVRATMLSRYCGGARATAAVIQMQPVALLANTAISVPAAIAVYWVTGPSLLFALILANLAVTFLLASLIWVKSRDLGMGARIGKHLPKLGEFGEKLDQHLSEPEKSRFSRALRWEFTGRLFQVAQNAALVLAAGGKTGILQAFCSEAIHLVGAAVGDLIPAQLGMTELSYRFAGATLGLSSADALSIPLLAHAAQLIWVAVGWLVPLFLAVGPECIFGSRCTDALVGQLAH